MVLRKTLTFGAGVLSGLLLYALFRKKTIGSNDLLIFENTTGNEVTGLRVGDTFFVRWSFTNPDPNDTVQLITYVENNVARVAPRNFGASDTVGPLLMTTASLAGQPFPVAWSAEVNLVDINGNIKRTIGKTLQVVA